jgi:hypothetical protein
MQRTQPQALTTKELLALVYAMQYEVPTAYVRELCIRLGEALTDSQVAEKDPRQLELPL